MTHSFVVIWLNMTDLSIFYFSGVKLAFSLRNYITEMTVIFCCFLNLFLFIIYYFIIHFYGPTQNLVLPNGMIKMTQSGPWSLLQRTSCLLDFPIGIFCMVHIVNFHSIIYFKKHEIWIWIVKTGGKSIRVSEKVVWVVYNHHQFAQL